MLETVRNFRLVWYRSRPIEATELTMKAMEDRGSLTVEPGRLVFHGRKQTVEITGISDISADRHGRDFINRWITITYGDGNTALFVDGSLMGWGGILGGNKKLRRAIEAAVGLA
jgi:hypothetical protein